MARFEWPSIRGATTEQIRAMSASMQELMAERGIKGHMQLAKVAKTSPGAIRNPLMARTFTTEANAKRIARALDVPLERLLSPKTPFTPYGGVRKRKGGLKDNPRNNPKLVRSIDLHNSVPAAPFASPEVAVAVATGKRKYTKRQKPNGHDVAPDPRWILPTSMTPPVVKMETTTDQPHAAYVEVPRTMVPADVAMSLYTLLNEYRIEKPDES